MILGIPECGYIPVIGKEEIERQKEVVERLRVKVRCEKCHTDEVRTGTSLMKDETSVIRVIVGHHPGLYYFLECKKCGYPLLKEVEHYVRKPTRKYAGEKSEGMA